MTTLANLPALPTNAEIVERVASADSAAVGKFMTDSGPVIIFSDVKAREAYTTHVVGNFGQKGQYVDSHPETGEDVIVAYCHLR